jgi:hypothetical protein
LSSLVTGATAVLSGLVGYGTARGQRAVELRRLALDARKAEQAREDVAVQERRDLYLRYLAAVDRFPVLAMQEGGATSTAVDSFWDEFERAGTELELFGSEHVREQSEPVHRVLYEAFQMLSWNSPEFAKSVREVYDRGTRERLHDTREALIRAMRADVGHASPAATPMRD